MKIDINAFLDSLPIMGVGLLGIFIVTAVLIVGIYILKALTPNDAEEKAAKESSDAKEQKAINYDVKKESQVDILNPHEKQDFLEKDNHFDISQDL